MNEELTIFYETHYKPTLAKEERLSYSKYGNTIGYTATAILTCLETNIKTHFTKHLRRFINIQFENDKQTTEKQTKEEKQQLYKQTKILFDDIIYNTDKSENEYKAWKTTHKSFLIPEKIKKNVHYDLECSPQHYLSPMIYMSLKLEEQEKKLFQDLEKTTDKHLRANLLKQAEQTLFDEMPAIPVFTQNLQYLVRKNIDLVILDVGIYDFKWTRIESGNKGE